MSLPKFARFFLLLGLLFAVWPVLAQEGGGVAGAKVTVGGQPHELTAGLNLIETETATELYHYQPSSGRVQRIPLWLSILPPLIAIGLALVFKEVIVSLFIGVFAGSWLANGMEIKGLFAALWTTVDTYLIGALNDAGHLSIIVFSLLIGGMVAIISRNGGMAGVVEGLSRYARTPRSAQAVTWFLGVAIFFDDYANTLIVGNTMRSVTDRFRISREKLAYIVDSTAAPVASVAFITTWIGAELGYIGDGIAQVDALAGMTPYAIFLSSLKYSFYPILTLCFILFLIYQQKDYGPMLKAERRARSTGAVKATSAALEAVEETEDLEPVAGSPRNPWFAIVPVFTVIVVTVIGLVMTGVESQGGWTGLSDIIGAADSYKALLWASISGVVVALVMTWSRKIMGLEQSMGALTSGFKSMFSAVMILTLAWALALTTEQLHTATFLVDLLGERLNPYFLPPVIFVLAALVSFSTGSSWSTMAILYPIAIPLAWAVATAAGWETEAALGLLYNVISTVLAASVLGDHCSPISDTTILSSLASDCNHLDHVRTQLPYALTVGSVALVCGFLSTLLGGGWLICLPLMAAGLAVLWSVVRFRGRAVENA